MSTDKDIHIQQMLDNNTAPDKPGNKDLDAYKQVFASLNADLKEGFSMRFTANILQKLTAKENRKFLYRIYVLFALMLVFLIAGFLFTGLPEGIKIIATTVTEHKWPVLFCTAVFCLVQFAGKGVRKGI